MHYTGMLAFRLPIPVAYDWPIALLSVVPSFLAFAVGLLVVSRWETRFMRTLAASIFMGGGISALHYTAMASARSRLPLLVLTSNSLRGVGDNDFARVATNKKQTLKTTTSNSTINQQKTIHS